MNNKIALVTGANRGIGKEISRQLAKKSYHVLIGCRNKEKGQLTVEEMRNAGFEVDLQIVDVSDQNSIKEMIREIKDKYGRLDVLVNNAGIILDRGISILEVEEKVMKETFETNFFAALTLIQAVIPLMNRANMEE
jgi:NAD(P)-dependent dehydrogenase (short-subunit alcohol dehydrogenase family)